MTMITRQQIKAARELLEWTQDDLAFELGDSSSVSAIRKLESGQTKNPRGGLLDRIKETMEDNNIIFTSNGGVDMSQNAVRIIEKGDIFLKVLDDVYHTLKEDGGELLLFFVDNKKSSEEIIQTELRNRKAGISMRCLVSELDRYFIYPLNEYRKVPAMYFKNHVQLVYGNKFVTIYPFGKDESGKQTYRAVIIKDIETAQAEKNKFNFFWSMCEQPKETIAEVIYE